MDQHIEESTGLTRKRRADPKNWKRAKEKRIKYSPKGLPSYPTCNHRTKLQRKLLTMKDLKNFHAAFYAIPEKAKQDTFLLKFCRTAPPKQRRVNAIKNNSVSKPKSAIYEYSIVNEVGNNLQVCRNTFLSTLNITKHRVIGAFNKFKKDGALVPIETRGGSRKVKLFENKCKSVINFIKKFKGIESHYNRSRSSGVYLASELNIATLWNMYKREVSDNLKVKEGYFRHIFNTRFNIGFSTPSTDECSTCLEFQHRLKIEKSEETRKEIMLKSVLHKKQANSFFQHLQEKEEDCLLMSFDCQKNLVLPKLSDQVAYYSRQFYCYNLSVVTGTSKGQLTPENVSIYTWTKDEANKSSNEVASIVFSELNSITFDDYSYVRLVADGCGEQNKNIDVIAMCAKWLHSYSPPNINKLEIVFPITGHSFLPSNRVFGFIEKNLKNKSTIISVHEYHSIFAKFGTVKVIGKDWFPYNWKHEANDIIKKATQLHFKISQSKKIIFRRTKKGNVVVKGELNYNLSAGIERPITKAGKTLEMMNPAQIDLGVKVKREKIQDVQKLLSKHFGLNWKELETLNWYVNIIENNSNNPDDNEENECKCYENRNEDPDIVAFQL